MRSRLTVVRSPIVCCELWVASPDGSGAVRVAGDAFSSGGRWASDPLWSPDGRVAYVGGVRDPAVFYELRDAEVRVVEADGSADRRLGPTFPGPVVALPRLLAWSPDGTRLLVVRGQELWLAGGGLLQALAGDLRCCSPSPDASTVVAFKPSAQGVQLRRITLGEPGQGTLVASGVGPQASSFTESASWSPDGGALAITRDGECAALIGIYVAERGRVRRLTNPCRHLGTAAGDRLTGRAGADALYGRGGADTIDGRGGADYLDGGRGDDTLYGNLGDDRLVGGPGRDRLDGGPGWDRVYARDGERDVVACGPGRDGVVADTIDRLARDCEVLQRGTLATAESRHVVAP